MKIVLYGQRQAETFYPSRWERIGEWDPNMSTAFLLPDLTGYAAIRLEFVGEGGVGPKGLP